MSRHRSTTQQVLEWLAEGVSNSETGIQVVTLDNGTKLYTMSEERWNRGEMRSCMSALAKLCDRESDETVIMPTDSGRRMSVMTAERYDRLLHLATMAINAGLGD